MGRGSEGEDERGSKAGNSEGAGRLTPATAGSGSGSLGLLKEDSLLSDIFSVTWGETRSGWRLDWQVFAIQSDNCRHIQLKSARMGGWEDGRIRGRMHRMASGYMLDVWGKGGRI